jgi:hypothetical protein
MKTLFVSFMTILFFAACGSFPHTLPGLYVNASINEFGTVHDSLVVVASSGNDKYVIRRKMLIDYYRDEERLPKVRSDEWMAVYDNKTKSLSVQQNGKILYYDEEKNGLLLGKMLFKKVDVAKNANDLVSGNPLLR